MKSFLFGLPQELIPNEDFEDWLNGDGFRNNPEKVLEKKFLFDELNRLKEKFRSDIRDRSVIKNESGIPLSPIEILNLLQGHKNRIQKVRLMIEHENSIVKNLHKPTGVNYVVVRTYWIDNEGKKYRKFSKNIGSVEKVIINGQIPLEKVIEVESEIDRMMWNQYLMEYQSVIQDIPLINRIDLTYKKYNEDESCVIFNKETPYFGLSNMSGGFPLKENGRKIYSSEGLYQSCGFPHNPKLQERIICKTSGLYSKMVMKPFKKEMRNDWYDVKVDIMYYCLRLKLCQNWDKFGGVLRSTEGRTIVEKSNKDDFWGCKPDKDKNKVLHGRNVLGQLLMKLRDEYFTREQNDMLIVEPLRIPDFLFLGEPIRTINEGYD